MTQRPSHEVYTELQMLLDRIENLRAPASALLVIETVELPTNDVSHQQRAGEQRTPEKKLVSLRPHVEYSPDGKRQPGSIEIFLSYVEQDQELCFTLEGRLDVLKRQLEKKYQRNFFTHWSNANITPGRERRKEIEAHLATADVILLLVSWDFLGSNFCQEVELTTAMKRHKADEARVIPIILRPCPWEDEDFGGLEHLPTGNKPVTKWGNRDEAFVNIHRGIRKAIEELLSSPIFRRSKGMQR